VDWIDHLHGFLHQINHISAEHCSQSLLSRHISHCSFPIVHRPHCINRRWIPPILRRLPSPLDR
jgi:hypothetical protein